MRSKAREPSRPKTGAQPVDAACLDGIEGAGYEPQDLPRPDTAHPSDTTEHGHIRRLMTQLVHTTQRPVTTGRRALHWQHTDSILRDVKLTSNYKKS